MNQQLLNSLRKMAIIAGVVQPDGTFENTDGLRHGEEADEARALLKQSDELKAYYHLVFAEVIYRDNVKRHDVKGSRVHVFTKSVDEQFPSRRLSHIQNSAAMQARADVGMPPFFDVVAVNILGLFPLGQFTDTEFYAGIQAYTPTGDAPVPSRPMLSVVPTGQQKND